MSTHTRRSEQIVLKKMEKLLKDYDSKALKALTEGLPGGELSYRILGHKAQTVRECIDIVVTHLKY